ncbi:MAG: hypothetical protein ACRDHF_08350 [Tepidiformaceae bacterium]
MPIDPLRVPEHYLLVIASERAFNPEQVEARLSELKLPRPADDAAALAVAGQLISEGQGDWAAWVART